MVFIKTSENSSPLVSPGSFVIKQPKTDLHPLQISEMRKKEYPGSEVTIEKDLGSGSNYRQYLASYKSEGLKIYSLLTVPQGNPPIDGWPVIIFNHGYIPPAEYTTTGRYVAYTAAFSRNGYIVFKPDYRGHGDSEGNPEGAYYSTAYTIDVLNAVSSIKKSPGANPDKIGMWGHSMGGSITLRSMVVTKDIKVGVIWAGVVASYDDMIKNWRRAVPFMLSESERVIRRPGRQALIDKYGDTDKNPEFWQSISPINFTRDISGPLQLHHGTSDSEVPLLFSERLNEAMKTAGLAVEFYTYEGDDHNLSGNLTVALNRSVEFFDKILK
ncbi:peptidase [Candidatus Daviesbacteria bacterium RIFCSPLOWO2_02_FULL_41_8]|uniref:Peptidase n=3 Tax=Candidatus Daviesiibacteriota TaxID=1752718 RepID=A0A1F5NM61_9BACT|nr:MAG: peptidase [Candidatus Daviesbacteria bacterium RIFCSPHIGHO2_01_FULL_41_23]OGE33844.1 MAG: peptidase [Candidatus Daviesbacteria bacterium RIFCSPHIGHO2_02_FULL_41_10]OGE62114.1 MAG: peptidase [Candidatus Daviesbacteria bacterium RIFCSPLOWO2_01_FULL_41_32]OGE78470.1 MAG: peptidase [Candidatus Daviesbacteria bacterium RIFCSPLOWO2_02_FULL_41_8]